MRGQKLSDCRAGATGDRIFLERDQYIVLRCQFEDQRFIQWLDVAHVGDARIDDFKVNDADAASDVSFDDDVVAVAAAVAVVEIRPVAMASEQ